MIPSETAERIYELLIRVRRTEESIAEYYSEQEMKCPVHLSIGQEAVAVGVSVCLEDTDVVFSTHRCHSHYLAKGGDLNAMIAELYGMQAGCAAGLGGSMHLVDERVGMMGASAIVGGSIPLAVGAALKFKMANEANVAVCYFGDGACEEGVFHESMNFAAIHKLPVLFVCENNFVATASALEARRPRNNIFEHGQVFGIPGHQVDGNDVMAVKEITENAVKIARDGDGPSLIEGQTFRIMSHVGPQEDKTTGVRNPELWQEWREKCPVKQFETLCDLEGLLTQEQRQAIRDDFQKRIDEAFKLAKAGEPAVWV